MKPKITRSFGDLEKSVYYMWESDLRGKIQNHILVFGQIEHLNAFL